ncbi:hypothetical protein [Fodinicola acaciae]|uniref:hypothetical protein n=1 Tax=Fodinicola acaciae TaxID=2681555 RepID=UPI0013D310B5|nr:hypothetical protein [Fodinicola acaciae]
MKYPIPVVRHVVVASTPKNAGLSGTDSPGKTQRYDIRAAARVAAPEFAPLHRSKNYVVINKTVSSSGTTPFKVDVAQTALTPFDPEKKYAPPGMLWLSVNLVNPGVE